MKHFVKTVNSPWLFLCILCVFMGWLGYLGWVLLGVDLGELPLVRGFTLEDMLVDESAFPEGWSVSKKGPQLTSAPFGAFPLVEGASLYFEAPSGTAHETISHFLYLSESEELFERQLSTEFVVGEYGARWVAPEELTYQSFVADEFYYRCSLDECAPMCRMLGRYERYIVRFNVRMSPDFMTYQNFEYTLQAIDAQMAHYLSKSWLLVQSAR